MIGDSIKARQNSRRCKSSQRISGLEDFILDYIKTNSLILYRHDRRMTEDRGTEEVLERILPWGRRKWYIHTHTHTHTHIHTYIRIYIHTYTHIHTYIHTYIHTHTRIHTYIRTHTYTHIHTHINTYTHTYIHTHEHTHTYKHTHTRMHTASFHFNVEVSFNFFLIIYS
jgi:hypothetical protein